jgi:hypothetical protein
LMEIQKETRKEFVGGKSQASRPQAPRLSLPERNSQRWASKSQKNSRTRVRATEWFPVRSLGPQHGFQIRFTASPSISLLKSRFVDHFLERKR